MRPSAPAVRSAGALSLLLLFLLPSAAAQVPELPDLENPEDAFIGFALVTPQAYVETDYLTPATTTILIKDLSRDSGRGSDLPDGGVPVTPVSHNVRLDIVEIRPAEAEGWHIIFDSVKPTYGGDVVEATFRFTPTVQVNVPEIQVDIEGTYEHPNGYTYNQTVTLTARVRPYTNMAVQVANPVQRAGQFETVHYEVRITNNGVYPESFRVIASVDKSDILVVSPPSAYIAPGTTRSVNVSILTPQGKLYEPGRSAVLSFQVQSERGAMIPQVATLQIRGPYVPVYWVPLILVGLVSAGIVARDAREGSHLRKLEKGRPRRVQPTPRQAVLLAALKERDPEAYKEKRAALAALYASRRETYRAERKVRAKHDREERRQARLELKEEKRRRKLQAKADARQAKLDKKAAKKQAKIDRKQAKIDAKVQRKEQKQLAKRRKALEKEKAKLEKARAKIAAKQAKADAKAEKAAAREAKRQARAKARQR